MKNLLSEIVGHLLRREAEEGCDVFVGSILQQEANCLSIAYVLLCDRCCVVELLCGSCCCVLLCGSVVVWYCCCVV